MVQTHLLILIDIPGNRTHDLSVAELKPYSSTTSERSSFQSVSVLAEWLASRLVTTGIRFDRNGAKQRESIIERLRDATVPPRALSLSTLICPPQWMADKKLIGGSVEIEHLLHATCPTWYRVDQTRAECNLNHKEYATDNKWLSFAVEWSHIIYYRSDQVCYPPSIFFSDISRVENGAEALSKDYCK
ncbi:hypothetical protein J6590_071618 [Homalodisca vitripennis]|nr:hypothetical protein J6590_071618 [Homalodisca vitripennis]